MATFNLFDLYRVTVANPARSGVIPGTLKMAIFKAFTPNQITNDYFTSLVAATNEVAGTNYTAGGNACATPTWTGPDGAGLATFDASDPAVWLTSGTGFANARRAILYYDTGVAATSRLVAYSDDFGLDLGNTATDLLISLNAAGIFTSPR